MRCAVFPQIDLLQAANSERERERVYTKRNQYNRGQRLFLLRERERERERERVYTQNVINITEDRDSFC